jgi:hypothetical protein
LFISFVTSTVSERFAEVQFGQVWNHRLPSEDRAFTYFFKQQNLISLVLGLRHAYDETIVIICLLQKERERAYKTFAMVKSYNMGA